MTLSEAPPASPEVPPLDFAILSNSSKKRTQGAADLKYLILFNLNLNKNYYVVRNPRLANSKNTSKINSNESMN